MTSTAGPSASEPPRERPLSLGVIFLTIFIDLLGFTIIFPLFPALLHHYLATEARGGVLGALIAGIDRVGRLAGARGNYREVLFGGVIGSLYGFLQFVFAPLWGAWSDRVGRRRVLLVTIAGTAFSYLLWFVSGRFGVFILSRVIGGAFAGNLSVATAAVADVTTRENRAKGMGVVGVAFGLGFLFGPAIGSASALLDLTRAHPGWAAWGANPFSFAALLAFAFCLVNLGWVAARFRETLEPGRREDERVRIRHPLHELVAAEAGPARRTNWLYFIFTLAFAGMEFSLPFLADDRFGYGPTNMLWIFVFLGVVLILTQGVLVRRAVPRFGEKCVLLGGMALVCAGMVAIGLSPSRSLLYLGLALLGVGAGLANPSVSALVSLYSRTQRQGRMLGVFRSLGSLARGIGPLVACLIYWWKGPGAPFLLAAAVLVIPWLMALPLPQPEK
ncbi:MAG: MFS transporter [Opitutaceae bacterium]